MTAVVGTIEVSREKAVELIKNCKQFYRVSFIKRSTNSLREMICRNGVQKHLKGGELKFNPKAHSLVMVYSMDAKDYRSIGIEGIQEVKIAGIVYKVVDNAQKA